MDLLSIILIGLGPGAWEQYPLSFSFDLPSSFFNTVSLLFRAPKGHNIALQLIMATSGEGSNPSGRATPQPLAQLQELEPRVARRRLSQARHRATLAGLFSNLRKTVYSHSDLTASKVWGPGCGRNSLHTQGDCGAMGGDLPGAPTPTAPTPRAAARLGSGIHCGPLCCAICGRTWVEHELDLPHPRQTGLAGKGNSRAWSASGPCAWPSRGQG